MTYFVALLLIFALYLGSVSAHVYVKSWKTTSYSDFQPGQKEWKLQDTAYRRASDTIGWVGSKFLTRNKAIVRAGGKVILNLEGDTGRGYPHHHGHIQAYLGRCGSSPSACQRFDASTASYFKIQEKKDGVIQLRKQYSSQQGGDIWEVPIPKDVAAGSYIFRFEIITWGESVQSEGFQDQYYPSCGQLYVQSERKVPASHIPSIKLPGGYHDGNLPSSSNLPGPIVYSEYRRRRSLRSPSKSKTAKPPTL
ncbi:hypothetical protein KEM48_014248 [Puccinia striiformis f. sp. tritici PST-130]|nr:hypothetical protein KEM48_014248 [Puccinia striiformis f. sp. tritici PST-130]